MLTAFEQRTFEFVRAEGLFEGKKKVLVAVSGGADSVALLRCMCALRQEGKTRVELAAGHINHQLRGTQADADEQFAVKLAKELGVEIFSRRVDVAGFSELQRLSIESAARQLRRAELAAIARQAGCDAIATGHTKNDNAETVVHRLWRGTGYRGLGGIEPRKEFADGSVFVRPILWARRDEVTEYLLSAQAKVEPAGWREDRTNVDTQFTRNYIRHRLLPALQAQSTGDIIDELAELARRCRRFCHSVCVQAERLFAEATVEREGELRFDAEKFSAEPVWVKVECIRRGLGRLGCGEQRLRQEHYERVVRLAEKKLSRGRVTLPERFEAVRERRQLVLRKQHQGKRDKCEEVVELPVPGRVEFGRWIIEARQVQGGLKEMEEFKNGKSKYVEWFDAGKLSYPLMVRGRRDGDRFRPIGLGAEKKVGKFLSAAHLNQRQRRDVVIVCDAEKIIWVGPVRASEQARVTKETDRIIEVKMIKKE